MIRIKYVCEGKEMLPVHNVDYAPSAGSIVAIGETQYEVRSSRVEYPGENNPHSTTVIELGPVSAPKGAKAAHGKKQLNG